MHVSYRWVILIEAFMKMSVWSNSGLKVEHSGSAKHEETKTCIDTYCEKEEEKNYKEVAVDFVCDTSCKVWVLLLTIYK